MKLLYISILYVALVSCNPNQADSVKNIALDSSFESIVEKEKITELPFIYNSPLSISNKVFTTKNMLDDFFVPDSLENLEKFSDAFLLNPVMDSSWSGHFFKRLPPRGDHELLLYVYSNNNIARKEDSNSVINAFELLSLDRKGKISDRISLSCEGGKKFYWRISKTYLITIDMFIEDHSSEGILGDSINSKRFFQIQNNGNIVEYFVHPDEALSDSLPGMIMDGLRFLHRKGNVVNHLKEGAWDEYRIVPNVINTRTNGLTDILRVESNYKHGERDGVWKYYFQERSDISDADGNVKSNEVINEKLIATEHYVAGQLIDRQKQ